MNRQLVILVWRPSLFCLSFDHERIARCLGRWQVEISNEKKRYHISELTIHRMHLPQHFIKFPTIILGIPHLSLLIVNENLKQQLINPSLAFCKWYFPPQRFFYWNASFAPAFTAMSLSTWLGLFSWLKFPFLHYGFPHSGHFSSLSFQNSYSVNRGLFNNHRIGSVVNVALQCRGKWSISPCLRNTLTYTKSLSQKHSLCPWGNTEMWSKSKVR